MFPNPGIKPMSPALQTDYLLSETPGKPLQRLSVQFSPSIMSGSLQPHGLQHARPPCPSSTPGVYPNSCPIESMMPFNHLILCHLLLFLPSIFPSIRVFSNDSALHIRWPKCWSFSFNISPSNEHSGLISWFDLAVQGTQESSLASQFESINSSVLSLLYGPTLTSVRDSYFFKKFNNIVFHQDLMHC